VLCTTAAPACEAVGIEQVEEELEVLFFARMGRRRHQQEVARGLA
jgi:hypothetical protein